MKNKVNNRNGVENKAQGQKDRRILNRGLWLVKSSGLYLIREKTQGQNCVKIASAGKMRRDRIVVRMKRGTEKRQWKGSGTRVNNQAESGNQHAESRKAIKGIFYAVIGTKI